MLVTPDEASNIQGNEPDFAQRCQLVGMGLIAGLENMQTLIQQRLQGEIKCININ